MQKKLARYLQGQSHSKGLYKQNITFSTLSPKLQVRLKPNLVTWYSIIGWSALWKQWST